MAPWEWDNTKVMLWCYLLTLPAIESLVLARLRLPLRSLVRLRASSSRAPSALRPGRGGAGPVSRSWTSQEYQGVCAALAGVGPDERVATVQVHNHPVALCGHALVAGYAGHLWSHGLDAGRVEAELARLLSGDDDWQTLARHLHARYLFWGRRERAAFPFSTQPWTRLAPPVATGSWGALYRLP